MSSMEVAGFDHDEKRRFHGDRYPLTDLQPSMSSSANGIETIIFCEFDESEPQIHQRVHFAVTSMPASPVEVHSQNKIFNSCAKIRSASSSTLPKGVKFYLQPVPKAPIFEETEDNRHFPHHHPSKSFVTFKTWSSKKLDRKMTLVRGNKPIETEPDDIANVQTAEVDDLPARRYFDAFKGIEPDTLRDSEGILLPEDKQWPFLLRYPISSFSICLGISSQAILWKTLPTSASMKYLHINLTTNLILWLISVAVFVLVACIYLLKMALYFEAVRREYYHPIRINFFFAPWIVLLFLALGIPPSFAKNLPPALWYILMAPILCLELKIYGQWISGGQCRLSKVANPFNHLAIVGNFVGALLGASMGLREGPIFFFAVGLAHYIVLFVTLCQRLTTNETVIPKELRPVFFLFVAPPSVASMAWARIQDSFDNCSRIFYFIALFLYLSLVVRVNFFCGFKFSMAWWAYTFPMTGAAMVTIRYSNEVTNVATQALAVILCLVATMTVIALLVATIFHAIVIGDLFPNDIAIAISDRKPSPRKKWFQQHGSSDSAIDIENKDLEAAYSSETLRVAWEESP